MKKLLFLCCLICNLSLQAQNIKWGTLYQADKNLYGLTFLGIIDNNFYALGAEGGKLSLTSYLYMYDVNTLSMKDKLALKPLKEGGDTYFCNGVYIAESKLYLLYLTKGREKHILHIHDANMKFMEVSKKPSTPNLQKQQNVGTATYTSDSAKYVLISDVDMADISVTWYNGNNQTEIRKNKYVSPFKQVAFRHISTDIDANEQIYVLGKQYNTKATIKQDKEGNIKSKNYKIQETKKGESNYTHELLLLKPDGTQKKQTITFAKDEFLKDVNSFVNGNDNYCVFGFYNDSEKDNAKGFFVIVFDRDLNVIKKVKKDFDLEFIRSFNKKKAEAVKEFDFRKVIFNQDKTVFILAESNYNIITKSKSFTYTTYCRNDIMCIKLSQNMDIEFVKQIAKEQSGFDSRLVSFATILNGKDIKIIYGDDIRNRDIISGEVIANGSDVKSLFMLTIAGDGNISKKLLYESHPKSLYVAPGLCFQINKNKLLICSYWKTEVMWGILTIPE